MSEVIGISFEAMTEAKRSLSRARDAAESEKRNLILAKATLEVSGSPILKRTADPIYDQINVVKTRIDDIDRLMASTDYAVKKFQAVDDNIARRINNAGAESKTEKTILKTINTVGVPGGFITQEGRDSWNYFKVNKVNSRFTLDFSPEKLKQMKDAAEPFPTGYFITKDVIDNIGADAHKVFEGLKVKPYWEKGMPNAVFRDKMVGYELKVDMTGANGIAKNWYLYLVKNIIFIIWNFG